MQSLVVKRSVAYAGYKTSVSLEDAFWNGLKDIAKQRGTTVSALILSIDRNRQNPNLSSAIRLFVLNQIRTLAEQAANERPPSADHVDRMEVDRLMNFSSPRQ